VAEEAAAARDATDKDVEIGGAGLAAQAIELFCHPSPTTSRWT
jgi:hypothetical protein